jgi:hypothetical protein
MRNSAVGALGALFFSGGIVFGSGFLSQPVVPGTAGDLQCGAASAAQLRTTLYFGLARPGGAVSELDWQLFLRDDVTTRFPEGLTVWQASGQWRRADGHIEHEGSKVLLLVHPDTAPARSSVQAVIARYRERFDQESVLWETARVCVTS